jgi:hypothetical protein
VLLFAAEREYSSITDDKGWFSIWPVALDKYSFTVGGWGEGQLEVQGWHRGGINRAGLLFIKNKQCLSLGLVANLPTAVAPSFFGKVLSDSDST